MSHSVITRETMVPPLLGADPEIGSLWAEFLEDYSKEVEELPYYLFLAELARYLNDKLRSKRTDRFREIFEVIELWITEGDDYVQEAVVIGLLEDLQNNIVRYPDGKLSDFAPWLGKQTQRYWQEVTDFWETGKLITTE